MGNSNSNLTEAQFKQQWKQVDMVDGITVWENKQNPNQRVDQYIVRDEQIKNNQKLSQIRRKNPFLVNAQTLKNEGFSCQMDNNAKKLFVQKTPIRLSNLKDIPYPDIFHLYDVCLHGYQQLSHAVGFFSVDEDQVGINQKGQAKVWLSNHFQSNKVNGVAITESKMVGDILNMLNQVVDNDTCGNHPNLHSQIRSHEKITFAEAISKFVMYIRNNCEGEVLTRLSCVNQVGSGKIQNWCKTNQGNAIYSNIQNPSNQTFIAQAGGGVITNIAPGTSYANKISSSPSVLLNNSFANQSLRSDLQTFAQPSTVNTIVESRVGQPIPPNSLITSGIQRNSVIYPNMAQFVNPVSILPNPSVNFNNNPATSSNLVRVNSGTQNSNQFLQRNVTINPQIKFASNPNTFVPSPQVVQQIPQNIQRPVLVQNISYVPQPSNPTNFTHQFLQKQTTTLGSAITVSQTPIPTYNRPLQVVESISLGETREDSRLQQQRVLSQTIDLKDGRKIVQTINIPVPSNNQINVLKGSETIQWQDYTQKQKSDTNQLSNFGRTVPYSFDVTNDKKTQIKYKNQFTPVSDGKSSPQFLALLSQIKSGIGKDSSTDNYSSYLPSKTQASLENYSDLKYNSSKKYTGEIDSQLQAEIQKYNK